MLLKKKSSFVILFLIIIVAIFYINYNKRLLNKVKELKNLECSMYKKVDKLDESIDKVLKKNEISRNVFFDLGANIGEKTENFINLLDYGAVKNFGSNDFRLAFPVNKLSENWKINVIEGNSKHDRKLLTIKKKHSNNKHEITVFNGTIVTDYDGFISFYLDQDLNSKQVGSSILRHHPFVTANTKNEKIIQTKPCVDLARLLRQYNENDFVIVKLDIEGAEFELLVHLIKENVLNLIDILDIEYHKYLSPYKSEYNLFSKIFKKFNITELKISDF
jgi:FkbM family methyltransferase